MFEQEKMRCFQSIIDRPILNKLMRKDAAHFNVPGVPPKNIQTRVETKFVSIGTL